MNKRKNNRNKKESKESPKNLVEGVIETTKRGTGYVTAPGYEEDIEIPAGSLQTALNGDRVSISLLPKVKGERVKGEVKEILEEGKRSYVGRIEKNKETAFLVPDNRKMRTDIFLPPKEAKKVKEGQKVLVKIVSWKNPSQNPQGEVERVIGKEGEHETEMQSILLDRGIDTDFPTQVKKESEQIAKEAREEIKNYKEGVDDRRDFRDVTTFTIDPDTAKDFDDALSVKKISEDKFEIGVHIADVSHYVKESSELDREARERGFSVYLVDRTIPMLPEELSNDICSLKPETDRFTFSAVFEMNNKGEVSNKWFGKGIIYSDRRFTYEEAEDVLDGNKKEFKEELDILQNIASNLREKKLAEGAIEFEMDEIKFELDENGKPINIHKKKRLKTHRLVEEFMLLANKKVAHFVEKECFGGASPTFIYRVHDKPDPEKIEHLRIFLKAFGYEVESLKQNPKPRDITALLKKTSGSDIQSLVETSTLRSMTKAIYSVKNIGHFGLAFTDYTHFTSPIRRYPDLIVHRLLDQYLKGKRPPKDAYQKYAAIARHASEKELQAVDAERESVKFKQVQYMTNHIGETFDARITGVTEYGLFVQEEETLADGLVPLSSLSDDYYTLDQKSYVIEGKKTGKKYRLGEKIRVKVKDANPDKKQIGFELV